MSVSLQFHAKIFLYAQIKIFHALTYGLVAGQNLSSFRQTPSKLNGYKWGRETTSDKIISWHTVPLSIEIEKGSLLPVSKVVVQNGFIFNARNWTGSAWNWLKLWQSNKLVESLLSLWLTPPLPYLSLSLGRSLGWHPHLPATIFKESR